MGKNKTKDPELATFTLLNPDFYTVESREAIEENLSKDNELTDNETNDSL
ncbi:hypothetical protein [Virgibacillus dakarensis]|nr:hypothetical protein [Virgibacillus dakarensis]